MKQERIKFEKKFKEMIVGLLDSGQSAKQVSEDYDLNSSMIRKWRTDFHSEKESFTGNGKPSLTPAEKELRDLKKELAQVTMERDILKKAVGIFSKSSVKNVN